MLSLTVTNYNDKLLHPDPKRCHQGTVRGLARNGGTASTCGRKMAANKEGRTADKVRSSTVWVGRGSARNSSQNIQFIRLVSDLNESKRNARYIQGLCEKKLNPLNTAVGIHDARARIICREKWSSHRG